MTRQLPVVAACPLGAEFEGAVRVLEDAFNAELEISNRPLVGDACARIIDVRVPDGIVFRTAKRSNKKELPGVRTRAAERLTEPRLARPGRHTAIGVAIGIGAGIAMVFISGLPGPLAGRMREALG